MILAEDAGAGGKDLLVQGDGLVQASRRLVCACEVVAGGQGVGVVLAQDTGAGGKDLLVQGDGFVQASRRLVCVCEVVEDGEGVGVVWA